MLVEATRASTLGSPASPNGTWLTFPAGSVSVSPGSREICGHNPERQDEILGPNPAPGWAGYFCARFSAPLASWGVRQGSADAPGVQSGAGTELAAYAVFPAGTESVDVRVGVSFISTEQARASIDAEVPDGTPLEETARVTRAAWVDKLGRVQIEGASAEERVSFYTGFFHTLQVRLRCAEGPSVRG